MAQHGGNGAGMVQGTASLSWLARIVSVLGLLLFLGTVGLLGYEGLFNAGGTPVLTASIRDIAHDGANWHARILVENRGGATGAHVLVAGTLLKQGAAVETATVEFDYVPAGSTQEGGLFFTRAPAEHELRLRVLGYTAP